MRGTEKSGIIQNRKALKTLDSTNCRESWAPPVETRPGALPIVEGKRERVSCNLTGKRVTYKLEIKERSLNP